MYESAGAKLGARHAAERVQQCWKGCSRNPSEVKAQMRVGPTDNLIGLEQSLYVNSIDLPASNAAHGVMMCREPPDRDIAISDQGQQVRRVHVLNPSKGGDSARNVHDQPGVSSG